MSIARTISDKELCHEKLGDRFESALSDFDTSRRVDVLIDQFLSDEMVQGKSILDVGCGLGFFSERLHQRGADVTAVDIGPSLVERTRERVGCHAEIADALCLADQFGSDAFDGVVSSECIEHTPNPTAAVRQMIEVVKPGGFISISTPNIVWYPVVKLATVTGLRPFDGHENFSSWRRLCQTFSDHGATVVGQYGLHLFPFQIPLRGLSRWCDKHCQSARGAMINICLLARKNG